MQADCELLEAWRQGDADAGRELVNRHFTPMFRFFANKAVSEVEDLVQQTFLAAVEGRDRMTSGNFRAYLFAVARNLLYRRFRDAARHPEQESTSGLIASAPTPAEVVAAHEEQRLLLRALRRLPLDLQVLLELSYWEGLSDREIGIAMDLPMGTVKSRMRKGRLLLKDAIEEVGSAAELLTSTMQHFDDWIVDLRRRLGHAAQT